MVSIAQQEPDYDANGNMIRMPAPLEPRDNLICTYDAWDRMVTVHRDVHTSSSSSSGSQFVAEYWYDGLDRRIVKHADNKFMHFYYDSLNRVVEERSGASETVKGSVVDRQYVWGIDGRLVYIDHGVAHNVTPTNQQTR